MIASVRSHPFWRLLGYLWPTGDRDSRIRVVLAAAIVIAGRGLGLAMPFAYKAVIDRVNVQSPLSIILVCVVAYALARFGSVLFDSLRTPVFEIVAQRAIARLTTEAFAKIHGLDAAFHAGRRSGPLLKVLERAMRGVDTVLFFTLFNVVPTCLELVAVAVILAIQFGTPMLVGTALLFAAYFLFTKVITERRAALRRAMIERELVVSDLGMDSLINAETIRHFGAADAEVARYRTAMDDYASAKARNETSVSVLNIGQAAITSLAVAAAMAFTVFSWRSGPLTPGDIVLVNTLLIQAFTPLDMLGAVYREVRQGLVDLEQLFGLLGETPTVLDTGRSHLPRPVRGEVTFDNVEFGYEPARSACRGISFTIPAGGQLGIVGPTGAGKSTITRLLTRTYDVAGGAVRIDGFDVREFTLSDLRAAIAVVAQDTALFNRTIAENIALTDGLADPARIEEVARRAGLGGLIDTWPAGLATRVGERGVLLSGGERQRIAIARALLRDAPILIFDEATSALDSLTEAAIRRALLDYRRERTVVIVAHRLSTVADTDHVIVLDRGTIIEQGPPDRLLQERGLYARMWEAQRVVAP